MTTPFDYERERVNLNHPSRDQRLIAVGRLAEAKALFAFSFPEPGEDVNSHIHTIYSFSPYSPSMAVLKSIEAGLLTTGIMDHDSVSGATEFTLAGEALGIKTTVGCEIRASFAGTFLAETRINNPDQNGVAYLALHGIPKQSLPAVDAFLRPIRLARAKRNAVMAKKLATLLAPLGIAYEYADAVALSAWDEGGEVTERHLLSAVAKKLETKAAETNTPLAHLLEERLGLKLTDKAEDQLSDETNPHRHYDLIGILKSDLIGKVYVPATGDECPPVEAVISFAKAHGIILAYPYLGDIKSSVTGDKKAQTFEDSYLDELFALLAKLGFEAVTYMPSRNTTDQQDRLMALARRYNFFQISGEDINQSRQSFICEAMRQERFDHLKTAAKALIGHGTSASEDLALGMFSARSKATWPDLDERIRHFASLID